MRSELDVSRSRTMLGWVGSVGSEGLGHLWPPAAGSVPHHWQLLVRAVFL